MSPFLFLERTLTIGGIQLRVLQRDPLWWDASQSLRRLVVVGQQLLGVVRKAVPAVAEALVVVVAADSQHEPYRPSANNPGGQ